MTVIAALKISKSAVLMTGDCAVTLDGCCYEKEEKVKHVPPIILGTSGTMSHCNLLEGRLERVIKGRHNLRRVRKKIEKTYRGIWKQEFQSVELDRYGIKSWELTTLNDKLLKELMEKSEDSDFFKPHLLFCGVYDGEAEIFRIDKFTKRVEKKSPYWSIGGGGDLIDKVVMAQLDPASTTMSENYAIQVLVGGMHAASYHKGVGRLMTMHKLDLNGHHELSIQASNLLLNAHILHKKGIIHHVSYDNIMEAVDFDNEGPLYKTFNEETKGIRLLDMLKKFPLHT